MCVPGERSDQLFLKKVICSSWIYSGYSYTNFFVQYVNKKYELLVKSFLNRLPIKMYVNQMYLSSSFKTGFCIFW